MIQKASGILGGEPGSPASSREGQMTPERWRRIGELYEAAVRIDPAGRDAWLHAACGVDDELRTEAARRRGRVLCSLT